MIHIKNQYLLGHQFQATRDRSRVDIRPSLAQALQVEESHRLKEKKYFYVFVPRANAISREQ
jgi:hypothetical protein